jgi:hypothetical protein
MRATQMHLLIQVRKRRGVTTSVDAAAVGIDLSWPRRARSSAKDTVHHELVPLVPSFATSLVLIKGIIGIIC